MSQVHWVYECSVMCRERFLKFLWVICFNNWLYCLKCSDNKPYCLFNSWVYVLQCKYIYIYMCVCVCVYILAPIHTYLRTCKKFVVDQNKTTEILFLPSGTRFPKQLDFFDFSQVWPFSMSIILMKMSMEHCWNDANRENTTYWGNPVSVSFCTPWFSRGLTCDGTRTSALTGVTNRLRHCSAKIRLKLMSVVDAGRSSHRTECTVSRRTVR
jgi:hypothetical protein